VDLAALDIAILVALGLAAGVLGGMLGIGGSVVMIPGMALLFAARPFDSQHLYQAAAMIVNVAVAIPASLRHHRAGTIRRDIFNRMLWPTLIAIVAGVLLSNLLDTRILRILFALFLLYIVADNAFKLARKAADHDEASMRPTPLRIGASGGVMGFIAGLLGVGGGAIAVPLLQLLAKVPLRHAIGVSSGVMVITATVGAAFKVATVPQHDIPITRPLVLAACLVPTAFIGGRLGAALTHRAPLFWVRAVFTATMLIVALRMALSA
jgi:uncharacterized membrane protein YfcA